MGMPGFDMKSMMNSMMGANGGKGIPGLPQMPPGMEMDKMMAMMQQGGMPGAGRGITPPPPTAPDFSAQSLNDLMGDMD